MKERHLFTLLSVEAAACVLFCILQRSLSGLFSTLIAFPFEQIGAGLRVLSLSGAVGNVVAIILYCWELSLLEFGDSCTGARNQNPWISCFWLSALFFS